MKKLTVIIVAILFVILVVKLKDSFSINIVSKNTDTSTTVNNSASPNSPRGKTTSKTGEAGAASERVNQNKGGLETRESNDGPVSIAVTPRSLEEGSSWDFDIALNTHSEELGEDLVVVSELVDDKGKSYKPTTWEGAPPGGHHRSGILKFNPISPKPKSIEIKIKNVGGITERSFKWNL